MSIKRLFHLTRAQKWLIAGSVLLVIVILSLEWAVERRAQRLMDSYVETGKAEVDFTLLINQISVTIPDSVVVERTDSARVSLKSGRVNLCGFGFWKYILSGEPSVNIIEISAKSIDVDYIAPSQNTNFRQHLFLDALRLTTDTFNFNLNKIVSRGSDFRVELEQLNRTDSTFGFELVKLEGRDLLYDDPVTVRLEVDEVFLGSNQGPLITSGLRMVESPSNEHNRVMVEMAVDSMRVMDMRGLGREPEWSAGHVEIDGLHFDIDQIGERPFCDGREPCVQKLLTDILIQAPVRDSIRVNGDLIFRHFEDRAISSELTLNRYDCLIRYDTSWHFRDPTSSSCKVIIKAQANGGIPVSFEGTFRGTQQYSYSFCLETFQMPLLNPSIPAQDGYEIIIESGKCESFCMDVRGEGRESVANYNIEYKALSLDVQGDKKFKSKLIKSALPLAVHRHFQSEGTLQHESRLPEERVFLYEIGDHVNEGFKMAVLKSWLR